MEDRKNGLLQEGEDAYRQDAAASSAPAPTFEEFGPVYVQEWLHVEDYSERTRSEYTRLLKSDVYPRFGTKRLDALTLPDIQKLKGEYLSEEVSKKTANNVLTLISQVLKYAVKAGKIATVPCTITQFDVDDAEMERYSDEVFASLVAAAAGIGTRYVVLVLLAGDAGLRRGELVGLEWTDIDFKDGVLHVRRQESRGKVGPPKGGKQRTVPMTERLKTALQALKKSRTTTERRVLARDASYRWDRNQERVKDRTLQNWMELIEQSVGIEGGTGRLHILRHTFCSRLADRGVPAGHIQKLAGHASITTTERYMHYSDEGLGKAIAALDGALAPSSGALAASWRPGPAR